MRLLKLKLSIYIALLIASIPICAFSDIIYVDNRAPYGGNGESWRRPFNNLQIALNNAVQLDDIHLAQGIYKPQKMLNPPDPLTVSFVMKKKVRILGGYLGYGHINPDKRDINLYVTILSGDLLGDDRENFQNRSDNCYHVIRNDKNYLSKSAVLDGCTISGGYAIGPGTYGNGGGIYNYASSPIITNCIFKDNWAKLAGAMYNEHSSSPVVDSCLFTKNFCYNKASGIVNYYSSSPIITNCTFTENGCDAIAGVSCRYSSSPIIHDCRFTNNHCKKGTCCMEISQFSSPVITECKFINNKTDKGSAGGINIYSSSSPLIKDCLFKKNRSVRGGAIEINQASPTLINCTFKENEALSQGGAINISDTSSVFVIGCLFYKNYAGKDGGAIKVDEATPCIINSIFAENCAVDEGGGIYNDKFAPYELINCTLFNNTATNGGGLFSCENDKLKIANCVFWENLKGQIVYSEGPKLNVSYSDVQGGYIGVGNIDQDPIFIDKYNFDYHIAYNSPCKDSGNNKEAVVTEDFENDPRISNGTVDIG